MDSKIPLHYYIPILVYVDSSSSFVSIDLEELKQEVLDNKDYINNAFFIDQKFNVINLYEYFMEYFDSLPTLKTLKLNINFVNKDFPYIDLKSIPLSLMNDVEPVEVSGFIHQVLNDLHPLTYVSLDLNKKYYKFPFDYIELNLIKDYVKHNFLTCSLFFNEDNLSDFKFPMIKLNDFPCFDVFSVFTIKSNYFGSVPKINSWKLIKTPSERRYNLTFNNVPLSRKARNKIIYTYSKKRFQNLYSSSPTSRCAIDSDYFKDYPDIKRKIENHIGLSFINVEDVSKVNLLYEPSSKRCPDKDVSSSSHLFLHFFSYYSFSKLANPREVSKIRSYRKIYSGPCYRVKLSSIIEEINLYVKEQFFYVCTPEQYEQSMKNMKREDLVKCWENKPDFIFITSSWCERAYGKDSNLYPMASPNLKRLSFRNWIIGSLLSKISNISSESLEKTFRIFTPKNSRYKVVATNYNRLMQKVLISE